MALKLDINASEILAQFKEFKEEVKAELQVAFNKLVFDTYANISEEASKGLSTATNRIYMEALSQPEQISEGVYVISLDESAFWIEEGMERHDMHDDLLKGKNHRVIPFRYDKPESRNTALTEGLKMEINQKLKKEKLSISKIETDANGSPKVGKLHEFSFTGPGKFVNWRKRNAKETHALSRLSIYQSLSKETGKVKRDVLVFRTISRAPSSQGKWIHPGYKAKKFMDEAMSRAMESWEQTYLPELKTKYGVR